MENWMLKQILKIMALLLFLVSLAACGSQPPQQTPPVSSITQPAPAAGTPAVATSVSSAAAVLQRVSGKYIFTEGPAVDAGGNVYFSDINAGKIYKWTPDGKVTVFREGLNAPNGLEFDKKGQLIACEGGNGRLISIDPQGLITVLADQYNQIRFNAPNDLWVDPQGGIYFTDPTYSPPIYQDGEDVYYLPSDHSRVLRVIDDMVRPNGIVGTADGKILYVADHGAGQIFRYDIDKNGTLSNKRLFAPTGSDGMTLDDENNLYLTVPNRVQIFDAAGNHLRDIPTPENPTNVAFGGSDRRTLFITARTEVYTLQNKLP
jgi:gluconolactonase